jgi:hypothetical protein
MDTSNNIVEFPKSYSGKFPTTREEANESLDATRQYYVQETLNLLISNIFSHLDMAGFAPSDPDNEFAIKEYAFIVESLRSHMYSHYGMIHPFQKIVSKVFVDSGTDTETGETVLSIADTLKINLKPKNLSK